MHILASHIFQFLCSCISLLSLLKIWKRWVVLSSTCLLCFLSSWSTLAIHLFQVKKYFKPIFSPAAMLLFFPLVQKEGINTGLKNIMLSAVAFVILGQAVHTLGAFADMGYYADPSLSGVWSRIMMPSSAPPPFEFYALSAMASLATGLVFAYGYSLVVKAFTKDKAFNAEKPWKTGAKYGLFAFALTAIGTLSVPLLVNLPFALAFSWTIQGLLSMVLSGAATGMIFGRK